MVKFFFLYRNFKGPREVPFKYPLNVRDARVKGEYACFVFVFFPLDITISWRNNEVKTHSRASGILNPHRPNPLPFPSTHPPQLPIDIVSVSREVKEGRRFTAPALLGYSCLYRVFFFQVLLINLLGGTRCQIIRYKHHMHKQIYLESLIIVSLHLEHEKSEGKLWLLFSQNYGFSNTNAISSFSFSPIWLKFWDKSIEWL